MIKKILLLISIIPFIPTTVPAKYNKLILKEISIMGKKDIIIPSIIDICEDTEGKTYILSGRNDCKIYVFNSEGKFLRSFGKRGEGPGELRFPNEISICSEGNLIVCEYRDLVTEYTKEGKFLRRFNLSSRIGTNIYQVKYGGNGKFFGRINKKTDEQSLQIIDINTGKTSPTPLQIDLHRIPFKLDGRKVNFTFFSDAYSPKYISSYYKGVSLFAHSRVNKIYLRKSDIGKTLCIDTEANALGFSPEELEITRKKVMKLKWPDQIKKQILKQIPERKNIFYNIFLTSSQIWALMLKNNAYSDDEPFKARLFNLKGVPEGVVSLKDEPIYITDKYIYFSQEDSDEDLILKKYAYRIEKPTQ